MFEEVRKQQDFLTAYADLTVLGCMQHVDRFSVFKDYPSRPGKNSTGNVQSCRSSSNLELPDRDLFLDLIFISSHCLEIIAFQPPVELDELNESDEEVPRAIFKGELL